MCIPLIMHNNVMNFSWLLEDILKTSWKLPQDLLKTSSRPLEDFSRTSWRHSLNLMNTLDIDYYHVHFIMLFFFGFWIWIMLRCLTTTCKLYIEDNVILIANLSTLFYRYYMQAIPTSPWETVATNPLMMMQWLYSFDEAHADKEGEKRKRSPKSVDRMKSFNCKNKHSS